MVKYKDSILYQSVLLKSISQMANKNANHDCIMQTRTVPTDYTTTALIIRFVSFNRSRTRTDKK